MIKYVCLKTSDNTYHVNYGKSNRVFDGNSKLPKTVRDFIVEKSANCEVSGGKSEKLYMWK